MSEHPCEALDYDAVFVTLLRGATALADEGRGDLSEELASTALGFRSELRACSTVREGRRELDEMREQLEADSDE